MRHKNENEGRKDKILRRRQLKMRMEGNNKGQLLTPTRRPQHMLHMQRGHIYQIEIFNV